MKKYSLILLFFTISFKSFGQINAPTPVSTSISGENPFLDLSEFSIGAPLGYGNNEGKGMVFPTTDLTAWEFSIAFLGTIFPTAFDGMIVYNTGTGNSATTGANPSTVTVVAPGFYYFSNPTGISTNSVTAGIWKPMGGGNPKFTVVTNTATPTNLINNAADQEKVIYLNGSANGTSTEIDLGTVNIAANHVKQFRKALVYDASGTLVVEATGTYDKATNKFVTGNGMMNILLPLASNYKVELYFTSN